MVQYTAPMVFSARTVDDLREYLGSLGARPVHVRRVLTVWLGGSALDEPGGDRRSERARGRTARRPAALESALPALASDLARLAVEESRHPASDGSCRRLLRLRSGHTVEAVDLPRDGLCVSTQVGCAVGCRFCRTGEEGLIDQLSSLEILAQVVLARRERSVKRVVFMGMGEPAHNLSAGLDAVAALGGEGRFAHKNLVFSTVGDLRAIDRLRAGSVRPGLALSLHTLDPDLRAELLPRAPRVSPEAVLDAALAYSDYTGYPLVVQWTLLAGVNDSKGEALRLAARLEGRQAIVNYIPFNSIEGSGFRRPEIERCVELVRMLEGRGVRAALRHSAGQEVDGGCGQLRAQRSVRPRASSD